MTIHKLIVSAVLGLSILAAASPASFAQHSRPWHGDIRHFRDHDLHRWSSGHWVRGRHEGYFGWWWVVGSLWYFYPSPVYPYPSPYVPPVVVEPQPPVVIQPPPSPAPPTTQYWYYCEPAGAYYPYVSSCPTEWKKVPVVPPGAEQQPGAQSSPGAPQQ